MSEQELKPLPCPNCETLKQKITELTTQYADQLRGFWDGICGECAKNKKEAEQKVTSLEAKCAGLVAALEKSLSWLRQFNGQIVTDCFISGRSFVTNNYDREQEIISALSDTAPILAKVKAEAKAEAFDEAAGLVPTAYNWLAEQYEDKAAALRAGGEGTRGKS